MPEPTAAFIVEAPDMPCWETLLDLTPEQISDLPARFHIPRFDDCGQPNLWFCFACSQQEGVITAWPCATAQKHGKDVFDSDAGDRWRARAALLQQRFDAIAELADALGDQLPGDGWHLAHAIKRLADGTATPDEIAAELGD